MLLLWFIMHQLGGVVCVLYSCVALCYTVLLSCSILCCAVLLYTVTWGSDWGEQVHFRCWPDYRTELHCYVSGCRLLFHQWVFCWKGRKSSHDVSIYCFSIAFSSACVAFTSAFIPSGSPCNVILPHFSHWLLSSHTFPFLFFFSLLSTSPLFLTVPAFYFLRQVDGAITLVDLNA